MSTQCVSASQCVGSASTRCERQCVGALVRIENAHAHALAAAPTNQSSASVRWCAGEQGDGHWRPVLGWPEYMVSSQGTVRGLERTVIRRNGSPYRVRAHILTPKTHHPSGLQSVTLARAGYYITACVHTLVADAFGCVETDALALRRSSPPGGWSNPSVR
jgi:NUMOD4 motif